MLLATLAFCISYDINRSKLIDKFAFITHCSKEQIVGWSCKICSSTPRLIDVSYLYNNRTNVMGYLGYNAADKEIVVSWRATKDAKNWLEDFLFTFTDYPRCKGCQIHEGLYFDYLSVHNSLVKEVTDLITKYGEVKLLVTGSSLGSALASIAAL